MAKRQTPHIINIILRQTSAAIFLPFFRTIYAMCVILDDDNTINDNEKILTRQSAQHLALQSFLAH